jgi:hypothetical protein
MKFIDLLSEGVVNYGKINLAVADRESFKKEVKHLQFIIANLYHEYIDTVKTKDLESGQTPIVFAKLKIDYFNKSNDNVDSVQVLFNVDFASKDSKEYSIDFGEQGSSNITVSFGSNPQIFKNLSNSSNFEKISNKITKDILTAISK